MTLSSNQSDPIGYLVAVYTEQLVRKLRATTAGIHFTCEEQFLCEKRPCSNASNGINPTFASRNGYGR
jgi:hypothetical protein